MVSEVLFTGVSVMCSVRKKHGFGVLLTEVSY